jgi:hypothetical protein
MLSAPVVPATITAVSLSGSWEGGSGIPSVGSSGTAWLAVRSARRLSPPMMIGGRTNARA